MVNRFVPIYKLFMRRLILYQPKAVVSYLDHSKFLFNHYRIQEKLDRGELS